MKDKILKYFSIGLVALALSSCGLLPYKEKSLCQTSNLGKCLAIDKAYIEATTNVDQGGTSISGEDGKESPPPTQVSNNTNTLVQTLIYQNTQKLIGETETPLLRQAVVRKVLILPYTEKDLTQWLGPRYAFYIEREPQWVLDVKPYIAPFEIDNYANIFNQED